MPGCCMGASKGEGAAMPAAAGPGAGAPAGDGEGTARCGGVDRENVREWAGASRVGPRASATILAILRRSLMTCMCVGEARHGSVETTQQGQALLLPRVPTHKLPGHPALSGEANQRMPPDTKNCGACFSSSCPLFFSAKRCFCCRG